MAAKNISIQGYLFDGVGEGSFFTQLPWVKDQCQEKLGFCPYPGTLNLVFDEAGTRAWRRVRRQVNKIRLIPTSLEYCEASVYPARLYQLNVAVILPEVEKYPDNVIEVLADVNVRATLGLKTNDSIQVDFWIPCEGHNDGSQKS